MLATEVLACSSGTYRCQFVVTGPDCSRLRLEACGKLALIVELLVALRLHQRGGLLRPLVGLGDMPQMCIDAAQLVMDGR